MGAGGGGTPTLQLHAHASTMSPTGTRYTRRVTPRHKCAHTGTPAPHHAAAPRGRGPAHKRHAHAAPGPSSCHRHGGGHTHLSTMQPLTRVGTRVVGAVLPLLCWNSCWQLLCSQASGGLTTAGIIWAPTTHTMHVHVRAHIQTPLP